MPRLRWKWLAILAAIMVIGSSIAVYGVVATATPEPAPDTRASVVQSHIRLGMTYREGNRTMYRLGWHGVGSSGRREPYCWESEHAKYGIGVSFDKDDRAVSIHVGTYAPGRYLQRGSLA